MTPLCLLAAALLSGIEVKHAISPPPVGLDAAEFELWIPDSLPADRPVRGVIGSSHYHAGVSVYAAPKWRALAAKHDFAILRYKITSGGKPIDTSAACAKTLLQGLAEFGRLARRPEVPHAGIIPAGLSWAANQVCAFTSYIPDRVIAAVPFRATARDLALAASTDASRRVPLLHLGAGRERFDKYKPHQAHEGMDALVARGFLAAWLVQPGEEHHALGDLSYLEAWLEEVVALRIPANIPIGKPYALRPISESGWCGVFGVAQGVAKDSWKGGDGMIDVRITRAPKGAPAGKSWMPSERLTKAWKSCADSASAGPRCSPGEPEASWRGGWRWAARS